jgi:hypothetical protein
MLVCMHLTAWKCLYSWLIACLHLHHSRLITTVRLRLLTVYLHLKCCTLIIKTYFLLPDLDFLFHMFFLARYCKLLEENSFRGRTADFFYMLLFGATVLTGIVLIGGMIPYISETFARILFLSNSLTFMMVWDYQRL